MSCGLFSMFDPVCNLPFLGSVGGKWILVIPIVLMVPFQLMILPSSVSGVVGNNVVSFIMKITPRPVDSVVFMGMFMVIVSVNLSSLTPLSYAPSAHPGFVLPLSLSMFLPSIIGWMKEQGIRSFTSHLLPTGSPPLLWGFLVLVETVSTIIRPLTLAVRLVANIMAGHIFIEMLTNLVTSFPLTIPLGMGLFGGLMAFEMAVSVVQALVFTNLLSLFWSEQGEDH